MHSSDLQSLNHCLLFNECRGAAFLLILFIKESMSTTYQHGKAPKITFPSGKENNMHPRFVLL